MKTHASWDTKAIGGTGGGSTGGTDSSGKNTGGTQSTGNAFGQGANGAVEAAGGRTAVDSMVELQLY